MAANAFQPIPLVLETRSALPTSEAAYHLNRREQTLRIWALQNNGPVKCLRVGGRLQWPVDQIKACLGLGVAA
jgi:hypothetical protein